MLVHLRAIDRATAKDAPEGKQDEVNWNTKSTNASTTCTAGSVAAIPSDAAGTAAAGITSWEPEAAARPRLVSSPTLETIEQDPFEPPGSQRLRLYSESTVGDNSEESDASKGYQSRSPRGGRRAGLSNLRSCMPKSVRWAELVLLLLRRQGRVKVRDCWEDTDLGSSANLACYITSQSTSSIDGDGSNIVYNAWLETLTRRRTSASMKPHAPPRLSDMRPLGMLSCSRSSLMFNPNSTVRLIWMVIGCLFFGEEFLSMSMDVFEAPPWESSRILDFASFIYWVLDIVMTMRTSVYDNGRLATSNRVILRKYVRTWFIFDVGLVTIQAVSLLELDQGISSAGPRVLRLLRFARYGRLFRLARLGRLFMTLVEMTNSLLVATLVRAFFYLLFIGAFVHISGCIWYWVGQQSPSGWVQQWDDPPYPLNYMISVHWAATQLQGNNDVSAANLATERFVATLHVFISVIVLSLFVSRLTSILQTLELHWHRRHKLERDAQMYLEDHNISTGVSMQVKKYLEWRQRMGGQLHYEMPEKEMMQMLPVELRRLVLEERWSMTLARTPVFLAIRRQSLTLYRELCSDAFDVATCLPGKALFCYGSLCKHVWFVTAGDGHYLKYSTAMRTMKQLGRIRNSSQGRPHLPPHYWNKSSEVRAGSILSEAALWTVWVHIGDCVSATSLSVLSLDIERFLARVQSYPQVQANLGWHAVEFGSMMKEWDVSDLTTSVDLFQSREREERDLS